MSKDLPLGKLQPDLLQTLIEQYRIEDPRVKVGPGFGEDAAAVDLGDRYLLLAADPITFTPDRIGWYAVHVNANDIAAMGGEPRYFLSTVLLPEKGTKPEMVDSIFADVAQACREVGCVPVGGHTEVTFGLERPIVSGAMVGEVAHDRLVTSSGARAGDMLILTRGIAIEATAILARERAEEVTEKFGAKFQDKAARFLEEPGLSVLTAARAAGSRGTVHAFHDPTEGGIANALWELAEASGVGLMILESEIPRYWESVQLALLFGLNLLGAISSGSLLIAVPEPETPGVLEDLTEAGVDGYIIGRVVEKALGVKLMRGEEKLDLPRFDPDEVTRIL